MRLLESDGADFNPVNKGGLRSLAGPCGVGEGADWMLER